jgi:hypothetical protein
MTDEHSGTPQENTLRDSLKRTKVPLENDQLPDETSDNKHTNDCACSSQLIEEGYKVHITDKVDQLDGNQRKDLSCKRNELELYKGVADTRYSQ